jgi:pimeloyl-ACP methyl ester carboxylesterase
VPAASINGIRIAYEERGRGRPLVLVHPFAGGARFWEPQVGRLSARYRVVTYDARGHGASEVPATDEAYDEAIFIEDLRQLLGHLGIERACVGGLSMGGNIALRFGLTHPDLVDGLIICDAGSGSDDPEGWKQRSYGLASIVEGRGIEAFADAVLASPPVAQFVKLGPEQVQWLRRILIGHRPEGLVRTLRGEQATRPALYAYEEQLRRFTKPVLVVVGEHDQASLKPSTFLAEVLPDAELFVMAGAGHLTSAEDPKTFNARVDGFLSSIWRG